MTKEQRIANIVADLEGWKLNQMIMAHILK